jgi:hypothetical protein
MTRRAIFSEGRGLRARVARPYSCPRHNIIIGGKRTPGGQMGHAPARPIPSERACGARPSERVSRCETAFRGSAGDGAKGGFLGGMRSARPQRTAQLKPGHVMITGGGAKGWWPKGENIWIGAMPSLPGVRSPPHTTVRAEHRWPHGEPPGEVPRRRLSRKDALSAPGWLGLENSEACLTPKRGRHRPGDQKRGNVSRRPWPRFQVCEPAFHCHAANAWGRWEGMASPMGRVFPSAHSQTPGAPRPFSLRARGATVVGGLCHSIRNILRKEAALSQLPWTLIFPLRKSPRALSSLDNMYLKSLESISKVATGSGVPGKGSPWESSAIPKRTVRKNLFPSSGKKNSKHS